MIEVDREEFVERYMKQYPESDYDDEFFKKIITECAEEKYKKLLKNIPSLVLLDREGWEELKDIIVKLHMKHVFLENTPYAEDVVKLIEKLQRIVEGNPFGKSVDGKTVEGKKE